MIFVAEMNNYILAKHAVSAFLEELDEITLINGLNLLLAEYVLANVAERSRFRVEYGVSWNWIFGNFCLFGDALCTSDSLKTNFSIY